MCKKLRRTTLAITIICHPAIAAQPNFLFLLSDDQAWNGLSCQMHQYMGFSANPVIQTPNIAGLAAQGMRFSAAYSPAPVCSPTRISLQTGKSPAQCKWTKAAPVITPGDGFKLIPPTSRKSIIEEELTIGEVLQKVGYRTAHFGKWHLQGGGPESHGYQESDGETGNRDAEAHTDPNPVDIFGMGKRAMDFMEKSKASGKPFYIQMSYHALHYPQNATRAMTEKYRGLMPGGNDKEVGRAAISEDLDRGVGELLGKLDTLGLAGETYVIYMSDNGAGTKGAGLKGGKGDAWEGGIRVPMVVRGPGIRPGSWCHERVVGYDWFPTLCRLAGIQDPFPPQIEGGSLVHLLQGRADPIQRPREGLVFHFPHYQGDSPHTALYLGNHKLLRFYEDNSLYLYDINQDIRETQNLAPGNPVLAQTLLAKMGAYLEDIGAALPTPNPNFDPANPPSIKDVGQAQKGKGGKPGKDGKKGGKKERKSEPTEDPQAKDSKDSDTWEAEEYSGLRGEKELRDAFASKCFSWLTGSPADNEKLSVGKNAQFFGFVALRYQSGRAANRGTLGRALHSIATDAQREILAQAVNAEKAPLKEWWVEREKILTLLEGHLYSSTPVDGGQLNALGEKFSVLNAMVAIYEAKAFAAFEDLLSPAQAQQLASWRKDPESAGKAGEGNQVDGQGKVAKEDLKQLEDLYAKCFSWLTGKREDNEIIPIGQPAQFFGFVSIRHKSGHAASRGKIAKDFWNLLSPAQQSLLDQAIGIQNPVVREFLEKRHLFLVQLANLRTNPQQFEGPATRQLAVDMGHLEMQAALIEATAYRQIRVTMDQAQLDKAMKMRGEYILDESQVAKLDETERGKTLSILCIGCHGMPGQYRQGLPGPDLAGFLGRPIASYPGFQYSAALGQLSQQHQRWNPKLLDQFLASPKNFAPGTKMEFQGLLNAEDRQALIRYLMDNR
jgi:arylsulfatase A